MIRLLLALLVALVLASPAAAHTRSQSQSRWTVHGDTLEVRVEAEAIDVTRLYALGGGGSLAEVFAGEVRQGLSVSAGGEACGAIDAPHATLTDMGRVSATWRFDCPEGAMARGPLTIESRLFQRVAPTHLHFASVRDDEGRAAEAVLTDSRRSVELSLSAEPTSESFWGAFTRFVPIGAEHVWSGIDHVAFMLALVLLTAGDVRRVVFAATGFTLGHTATLGLAALDVVRPDGGAVEALIGFTIAFVALEAGAGGDARMRGWSGPAAALLAFAGIAALAGYAPMSPLVWFGLAMFVYAYPRGFPRGAAWVAGIFGLIHGCGFAGALSELDLPKQRLVASLFGFNVGVEFGQLTVIGAALLVGWAARRLPQRVRQEGVAVAGAALLALGTYWFVGRLIA
ncbi:MAG: HupE/UreJ family protein [Hyphomonadaceae bacterium]